MSFSDVKLEIRNSHPKTYIVTGFTEPDKLMVLLYSGFCRGKAQRVYQKYK